ncbi:MAG: hypothetical protein GF320_15970 [Armatimonadia bacterium]|nr:hypothetical protein [Armatimonadia bacterium]
MLRSPISLCCIALILAATSQADVRSPEQVRDDWLRQELVRWLPAADGSVTTAQDAAGGCDGIVDGRWGFHTAHDDPPWWQVDLGQSQPIDRVVIYNRTNGVSERAAELILKVSGDGDSWRQVYQHDGTVFYGHPDHAPLEVSLDDVTARYVRVELPVKTALHLDEVQIYGPDSDDNLALHQPADQSSTCQWSKPSPAHFTSGALRGPLDRALKSARRLAWDLEHARRDTSDERERLRAIARAAEASDADAEGLYLEARSIARDLMLGHPLLDFDDLLLTKRMPGRYSHMSDQYLSWWARPGGGIYLLKDFASDSPELICLTEDWPEGSFMRPELSYDGERVLFAYCRYYPGVAENRDKVDKMSIPEDAFYQLYEMRIDGSEVRQLTSGRYDDFDGRYLPTGDIVFLSTRRGQVIQSSGAFTLASLTACLPDSFVRCGGDSYRPVSVYTLHRMNAGGGEITPLSPFENFEWTPTIGDDGRILYARWDYVDRNTTGYIGLWSTLPDGTNPQLVYGNFTVAPHCVFEARSVPDSRKLIFTASGHHSTTGGPLVLLDPARGTEGAAPLTELTPEICYPEAEGWPDSYFANPYPLSETFWLTAWSDKPLLPEGSAQHGDAHGIYLGDAYGNLELLYRDPEISSMYPLPVKPRPRPTPLWGPREEIGPGMGEFLVLDVYEGLAGVERGAVESLRVVGCPPKVQPVKNDPHIGVTHDDPGKFVLGTVPVRDDGSARFVAPAGVPVFFQALDADGVAIQTMRTLTYLQPGQSMTCVGCHEDRETTPPNALASASTAEPKPLAPGPQGTWPLRYDELVQPILDRACVDCHGTDGAEPLLTADASWQALLDYGEPSLRDHVLARYEDGRSLVGRGAAATNPLLSLLQAGHHSAELTGPETRRLVTWMDLYGQRSGSYSPEQETELVALRDRLAPELYP